MIKQPKKNPRKIHQIIKQYESCCWVILFPSFGIGLLVSVLLNAPLGLIIGRTGSLIDSLSGFIATAAAIFMLSWKDGYRNCKFKHTQLLLGIVLTFATQVFLVIIFGHTAWFSGPTIFIARYVINIVYPDLTYGKEILENYRWTFMIIAFWIIYVPLIFFGKYLGLKKHKKDFIKYGD